MSEEKAIQEYRYDTDHGEVTLTPEIVQKYLVSGDGNISSAELAMFLNLCKYQKLNPFLREVYLIKYSNNSPASMVVGKDVHQKRAAKNPNYDGMESGVIVQRDGEIVEGDGSFTLPADIIVGGWAIGHRKDWSTPRKVTVSFEEYAGKKSNGELNKTWKKMPGTMIVKVAEAQCLRAMFPEELQALYNAEEMGKEPGDLSQAPIPVGTNKTVGELRTEIQQILDDNPALDEAYVEGVNEEAWATEDKIELSKILDDLKAEVKVSMKGEVKDMSDLGFQKAVELQKQENLARQHNEEPPLPSGGEAAPDELDIF